MSPAWISITITIAIFVLSHVVVSVWWASRINVLLDIVQTNLTELVTELKTMRELFYKKEDAAKDAMLNEKEHAAMWKKIDFIQEKLKGDKDG